MWVLKNECLVWKQLCAKNKIFNRLEALYREPVNLVNWIFFPHSPAFQNWTRNKQLKRLCLTDNMRVYFIGNNIKTFQRLRIKKSIELPQFTNYRYFYQVSGKGKDNWSQKLVVAKCLTCHTVIHRGYVFNYTIKSSTFSYNRLSYILMFNNIIISIIKKVFLLVTSGYPHKRSAFHTKINSRRKYFMASSSATLCASQCSFAIILWSFK